MKLGKIVETCNELYLNPKSGILCRSLFLFGVCLLMFIVFYLIIKKYDKFKKLFNISLGLTVLTFVIFLILMIGILILIGVPNDDNMVEPTLEVVATTVSIMASGLIGMITLWYQNSEKRKDYVESLLPYFSIAPCEDKTNDIIISFGAEDTKVPLQFVDIYLRYQENKSNNKWKKESFGSVWAKENLNYHKEKGNYDLVISAMTIKKQKVYFVYAEGINGENIKIENDEYILYPTKEKATENIIKMIESINDFE